HYARMVKSLPADAPNAERRWVGAKDETWLLLLQGQLAAAEDMARRALELAESYHTPVGARIESEVDLQTILLLRHGKSPVDRDQKLSRELPAGEAPASDLDWDELEALSACQRGDFAQAIEILRPWDKRLTDQHCLHSWFETRLRLTAAHLLAGDKKKAE